MVFDNLIHGFTTRLGGISLFPYNELNLGLTLIDILTNVKIIGNTIILISGYKI